MTSLADHLPTFLVWLGRNSLQAAVLVGVILIVQWLLRDRLAPRWRYGLWMILVVRLVMPWGPSTSFSLYNVLAYVPSPAVVSDTVPAPTVTSTDDSPSPAPQPQAVDAGVASSTPDIALPAGIATSAPASMPAASADRRLALTWPQILALVWLAGALAVAMTILRQSLRLSALSRHRLVTDQYVLDLLEDCKQQMGVSNYLAVVETEQVAGPALFGFVRPRLLLPQGLTASLGAEPLRHVFLHELAHLKRRDVLVSWIVALLQVLHWFNPLVWYGFARMRAERELACDALALSQQTSPEPKEYGRTIVQLLESHITPRYQPSLAGVLEDKSQLTRRITMIARFRKSSQVWSVPAVALLMLVGAVALTNAQTSQPAAAAPSTAELVAAARQVVTDMSKGDFARVTERFDSTMKAALPAAKLQTAWDGVVQQAGPFQEITGIRSEQFGPHKIIYVTGRFQQGPVDTKVVFDATGKIAGLFLVPTPIGANGMASSQPPSIAFSNQDLKVAPYKEGGLFQAVASVHNTGTAPSGRWEIRFGRFVPDKGTEAAPGGVGGVGPIEPNGTWREASMPFAIPDGTHVITAKLIPDGAADDILGFQVWAAVTVTVRDGKIVSQTPGAQGMPLEATPAAPCRYADVTIDPYKEGNLFTLRVKLHNPSDRTSPRYTLRYFRGNPRDAVPAGPESATNIDPIPSGGLSDSGSLPFELAEGTNVITAVLRPVDAPASAPSQLFSVIVTIKDGRIVTQLRAPNYYSDVPSRRGQDPARAGSKAGDPGTGRGGGRGQDPYRGGSRGEDPYRGSGRGADPAAAATSQESADPTANDSLLNEGQRLYVEWTQRQFAEFLNGSQYADLSSSTKAEMETKWLAALNGQKNTNYYQAISNLATIKSKKAVPGLLRIAADRTDKNNRDRWMATRALGLIGETIAVPQLIPLTYHYNQNTRFWAQISLVRLTGVNYETDWQAWGNWWNGQGKQPQVSMTPVAWTTKAELADLAKQKEDDAKMIEGLKGGGKAAVTHGGGNSGTSAAENPNRQALRTKYELRTRQDLQKYSREQLGQAERLYQVANKNWRSPEAKESLQQMIDKYPDINRTGCAVLYMAQMSEGPQREELLKQAIDKHGDCFYGDDVQVGAYARFYLAELYDSSGQKDQAKVLHDEIRKDFPDAVNHRGVSLVQLIDASHPKP